MIPSIPPTLKYDSDNNFVAFINDNLVDNIVYTNHQTLEIVMNEKFNNFSNMINNNGYSKGNKIKITATNLNGIVRGIDASDNAIDIDSNSDLATSLPIVKSRETFGKTYNENHFTIKFEVYNAVYPHSPDGVMGVDGVDENGDEYGNLKELIGYYAATAGSTTSKSRIHLTRNLPIVKNLEMTKVANSETVINSTRAGENSKSTFKANISWKYDRSKERNP